MAEDFNQASSENQETQPSAPVSGQYSYTRETLAAAGGVAQERPSAPGFGSAPTQPQQPVGEPSAQAAETQPVYKVDATQPQPGVSENPASAYEPQTTEPLEVTAEPVYENPAAQQPYANPAGQGQPQYHYTNPAAHAAAPAADAAPKSSQKPAKEKKSGGAKTFFVAFAGALVACVLALGGYTLITGGVGSTVIGGTGSAITANAEGDTLAEQVATKCLPSVAAIDVYTKQSSSSSMYGYLYGYDNSSSSSDGDLTKSSLGSGVVISEDGYVVTNYHVIEDADTLKVTINGTEYDADVVGSDASSDVAVVKVKNATGLTAIEIGDSDALTVGEWVMTIGSPFGLEQSVATGVVSATSRSQVVDNSNSYSSSGTTTIYPNMIQTDAAINPGNSGGALVDSQGKLIGLNTLITSYSGNYSGVGFAIPVNYAINLAQQIIDGKTPSHAALGVSIVSLNANTAARYGFSATSGAYVSSVNSGSGAESAGIQQGDIIVKVDDTEVASASDVMLAVRAKEVGDTVKVEVNRNGETKSFDVKLGEDSSTTTQQESSSEDSSSDGNGNGYGYGGYGSLEDILREYGLGGMGGQDDSSNS